MVAEHPLVRRARLDDETFAVRYDTATSGESAWFFLDNLYRETAAASRAHRRARIGQLIDAAMDATELPPWPQIRPLLRPVLRSDSFGLGTPFDRPGRFCRPALPYLSEYVVIDRPTSMTYVTAERVAEWGVAPGEVFAAARANLAEPASRAVATLTTRARQIVRFVDDGDAYFASWLLLDGFLAQAAERLGGPVVAFVPDTSTLMIMEADPVGVTGVLGVVGDQYNTAARALSPMAYTADGTGVVGVYRTDEPGELADRLHRAELQLAAGEYAAQRQVLQAEFERDGVDVFVGDLLVAGRPNGSQFSVAVWPDDCHALLPAADFVGFVQAGRPVTVPFPIVRAEAGLTPEPGLWPARYRVTAYPPERVLARLFDESVSP